MWTKPHRLSYQFASKNLKKRVIMGAGALALGLSSCLPTLFSSSATYCFLPISGCPLVVTLPVGASCFCSGAPGVPGIAG